jgi:SNF2 family DNA or RNA helicase
MPTPFNHQLTVADQIAVTGSAIILADEMGLGKTLTAILAIQKAGIARSLFVAPKEIIANLSLEIPLWTDIPVFDLRGKSRIERQAICQILDSVSKFILLVNLETWSRDKSMIEHLSRLRFEALVIDEAHHINNSETSAYRGVRELRYAINQCPKCQSAYRAQFLCIRKDCESRHKLNNFRYCLTCGFQQRQVSIPPCRTCRFQVREDLDNAMSVRHLIAMTGSTLVNQATDVWTLLHLVDRHEFPSQKGYIKAFCEPSPDGKPQFREHGERDLRLQLGSRYIRRTKEDAGIVLPPQSIEVLEYDIDEKRYPDQYRIYRQIKKSFAIQLEEQTVSIPEVVTQLMRLRQAITWPAGIVIRDPDTQEIIAQCNVEESQKLDICESLLRNYMAQGERCIAFSHFKAPLHELQRRLGNTTVVYDGSTSDKIRTAIKKDFAPHNSNPEWQAVLCNYRSAGEGLSFTGATQTIVIDEDWSPAKNGQAYGRTHRLGQHERTRVHIPRISKTVDTWMASLNASKVFGLDDALASLRETANS